MALATGNSPELVQEQVQRILIQPLEKASVFLAAGPRIFDTNGSPVRIPKLTGVTDPSWHGQNELIDEEEPDFGEVTLLPETMKSLKVITRFSNELARQSVVALDAVLRDRLVKDVAAKLDNALMVGSGAAGTEPKGIINCSGIQTLVNGQTGASLEKLHDAVGLCMAANVNTSSLRWMMTSKTFVAFRKLKDTANRYQMTPDPTAEGAYRLIGIPVTVTNRLPDNLGAGTNETRVVLADFSQIAVARDLSPSVKILDQTYANFDQLAIRVVARYDAAPLNPQAVVMITGIQP